VAAGSAHTLILCADCTVYACGRSTAGQLGLGASGEGAGCEHTPTLVGSLGGLAVRSVLAAGDASAALVHAPDAHDGALALYQWGRAPSQLAPVSLPTLASHGAGEWAPARLRMRLA